jgi:polyhydroxybutyrate depolymerase
VVAADVSRLEYSGCADDAEVVLYTIHGGGHTWPGGGPQPEWFAGPTSSGIDAARQTWTFFREHPLITGEVRPSSLSSPSSLRRQASRLPAQ